MFLNAELNKRMNIKEITQYFVSVNRMSNKQISTVIYNIYIKFISLVLLYSTYIKKIQIFLI